MVIKIAISILLGCLIVSAQDEMRLPGNLRPASYDIRMLPSFENDFNITSVIEIVVDCISDTYNITLNSADIEVDEYSIKVTDMESNEDVPVEGLNYHDDEEMITISVETALMRGKKYTIKMSFTAVLNNELRGFYRSTYEEDGVTKYVGVTQLEATDARRAFPCFDEPNFKATFTITLGRKESMTSASNMPLKEIIPIPEMPGYLWDRYETSLKMSTYLVAMMISEMVSVKSTPLDNNVEFRIWARPNLINQTEYAGDIGPKVLAFYEKYFDIKFPLPKQDMAAIPDFAAGAMENWGLITYREEDLLIDPTKSSAVAKQRVATVIAHELAHQWFGDLVTMDWWDSLWLNEGFAIYMQHIGTNAVLPEFQVNEQFITDVVHNAMSFDGLKKSRPMNVNVTTPYEIKQLFDAIAYQKGASVIKMCSKFLGEDTFERGLHLYLTRKAYGNAVQDDLWNALDDQAEIDQVILPTTLKEIMSSWTDKEGYPLIKVNRDYESGGAHIDQERFLMDPDSDTGSSDETVYQWWVPLTYTSNFDEPQKSAWLSDQKSSKQLITTVAQKDEWVIFNVDQVGYYRVLYDETNYELIKNQLFEKHTAISSKNRAQLIDDSMNIARANGLSYEHALDLTSYLHSERDYLPWRAASTALSYLDTMLYSTPEYGVWETYLSSLVTPVYDEVQFDEKSTDAHLLIYTRTIATEWACKIGNSDCIQHANSYYSKWMSSENSDNELSPNQKRLISCTAIENGGQSEWDFAYKIYLASTVAAEKKDLMSAMSCTKQSAILLHMLEMMIDSGSGIRLQDATELFSNVASTPLGNTIALDFLISRWDDIDEYFSGYAGFGGGALPTFFQSICNRVNTEEQLQKLMELYQDHIDTFEESQAAQQGIEVANSNLQWMNVNYDTISEWLNNYTPPTAPPTTQPTTEPTISTTPSSANVLQQTLSVFITALLSQLLVQLLLK